MGEMQAPRNCHGNNEVREALRVRLWPSLRWEEGAADLRESPGAPLGHLANVHAGPPGPEPKSRLGKDEDGWGGERQERKP